MIGGATKVTFGVASGWGARSLTALAVVLGLWVPGAAEARRKALVIGNGAYREGALKNPVADARGVQRALQAVGFEVTRHEELTSAQLAQVVNTFAATLAKDDVAFVYYAGHGIEVQRKNLLLGIDFAARLEADAVDQAYRLDRLLERLDQSGAALRIVVLDACRNDPFSRRWSRSTLGRGFTAVAREAIAHGTYLAFSTAPGSTADDGGGQSNSPFATALIRQLPVPGVELDVMFRRVRAEVSSATGGRQSPWTEHQLTGEFVFRPGRPPGPPPPGIETVDFRNIDLGKIRGASFKGVTLVDGKWSEPNGCRAGDEKCAAEAFALGRGCAEVALAKAEIAELNGSPGREAVLLLRSAGDGCGNSWAGVVYVVAKDAEGLRVVGELSLVDVEGAIGGFEVRGASLSVKAQLMGPDDPRCCPSVEATFRFDPKAGKFTR